MAGRPGIQARLAALALALALAQAAVADPAAPPPARPAPAAPVVTEPELWAELAVLRMQQIRPRLRPAAPLTSPAPAQAPARASVSTRSAPTMLIPALPAEAPGQSAQPAPFPRPDPARNPDPDRACTADGRTCIRQAHYISDVCRSIEDFAGEAGIDAHYFARLLWKESLFDASAVSHAGALGIAQFIPETAARRGLVDPFNPAEAMRASALYLADLAGMFGNLGMAAVAYNGGEARAERFLARQGGLPLETRAYVHAITGYSAARWRDDPPDTVDYRLDGAKPFQAACQARAEARNLREFRPPEGLMPWAMIYAAHPDRAAAEAKAAALRAQHPALLGDAELTVSRKTLPGRRRYFIAQIGYHTQAAASRTCNRLRLAGGGCMVLRN